MERKCPARRPSEAGRVVDGVPKKSFRDADAPDWGGVGVLELMKEWLDSVAPEAGV